MRPVQPTDPLSILHTPLNKKLGSWENVAKKYDVMRNWKWRKMRKLQRQPVQPPGPPPILHAHLKKTPGHWENVVKKSSVIRIWKTNVVMMEMSTRCTCNWEGLCPYSDYTRYSMLPNLQTRKDYWCWKARILNFMRNQRHSACLSWLAYLPYLGNLEADKGDAYILDPIDLDESEGIEEIQIENTDENDFSFGAGCQYENNIFAQVHSIPNRSQTDANQIDPKPMYIVGGYSWMLIMRRANGRSQQVLDGMGRPLRFRRLDDALEVLNIYNIRV